MNGMENAAQVLSKADALFDRGDIEGALSVIETGFREAESASDRASMLSLGNELLGFYRSFGRFSEAEVLCGTLSDLVEEMDLTSDVAGATTMLNVGTCFRVLGRAGDAERCYGAALDIYRKALPADDVRIAALYNNWGLLYRVTGEPEKAEEMFLKADAIVSSIEAGTESATTWVNLASLLGQTGRFEEAGSYIEKAIAFFESPAGKGDHHSIAAYAARAELFWRRGMYREAVDGYRETADLARAINAPERDIQIFLNNADRIEAKFLSGGSSESACGPEGSGKEGQDERS